MTRMPLLSRLAATWYLVGLCGLAQRVQSTLKSSVGRSGFVPDEKAHVARITPVLGPPMLIELATGLGLLSLDAGITPEGLA